MQRDSSPIDRDRSLASPMREIVVLLGDLVCGLLLFLLACCLAGILDHLTPFEYPNLYVAWFACGMIPFVVFGHRRGALKVTWPSAVQPLALVVFFSFVPITTLAPDVPGGTFVSCVVLVGALWLLNRLLSAVIPGFRDSATDHKET